MITRIVRRFDRRNREMAFFDLDCLGGYAEVIVFSDCFKLFGTLIKEESVVFIKGKLSDGSDFSDLKIIADEIIPANQVRERLSQRLNIKFTSGQVEGEDVEELMLLARKNQGNCRLIFHLPNQGSLKPLKIIAHNLMVSTESLFIKTLRLKYGKDNVWVD
jgi:DNA polymerase-3 subunit alpha